MGAEVKIQNKYEIFLAKWQARLSLRNLAQLTGFQKNDLPLREKPQEPKQVAPKHSNLAAQIATTPDTSRHSDLAAQVASLIKGNDSRATVLLSQLGLSSDQVETEDFEQLVKNALSKDRNLKKNIASNIRKANVNDQPRNPKSRDRQTYQSSGPDQLTSGENNIVKNNSVAICFENRIIDFSNRKDIGYFIQRYFEIRGNKQRGVSYAKEMAEWVKDPDGLRTRITKFVFEHAGEGSTYYMDNGDDRIYLALEYEEGTGKISKIIIQRIGSRNQKHSYTTRGNGRRN